MRSEPVLVTGATGYVGGRLVPLLLDAGYRVRVMGRSVAKLKSRPWAQHPNVGLTKGDVFDADSLEAAARISSPTGHLSSCMQRKRGFPGESLSPSRSSHPVSVPGGSIW